MYLFLHIGFEKTGSSAFQEAWFGIDAHALEKAQFGKHPSFMAPSSYALTTSFCDSSHLGRLDRPDGAFIPSLIEYLRQNVSSHILLSDEHLSSRLLHRSEIQSLAALLQSAGHELVVIAVTRDRDDWLRSKYSQAVKGGFYKSLEEYVENGGSRQTKELNVERTLRLWREVDARLILLSYSGDVVSRLFKTLKDITGKEFPTVLSPSRENVRLSKKQMNVLIKVNRLLAFSPPLRKIFKRVVMRI